jgi:hypothetical protein
MAMVHVAMFEAINFIQGRYIPHFIVTHRTLNGMSVEAAAAGAAHHVLIDLYPNQRAILAAALKTSLHTLPGRRASVSDVITGTSIAAIICAVRALEGGADEPSPDRIAPSQKALPKDTAPPKLKPWLLKSANQFRPKGRAPQGPLRTRDGKDVNASGIHVGAAHTDEQTQIGHFWSLNSPLSWNPMVAELIAIRGLSPIESARIHALASMAIADAYTAARNALHPCALCIAATAVATVLDSEFGAGGNNSKAVNPDQEMGREIGRYTLLHYLPVNRLTAAGAIR